MTFLFLLSDYRLSKTLVVLATEACPMPDRSLVTMAVCGLALLKLEYWLHDLGLSLWMSMELEMYLLLIFATLASVLNPRFSSWLGWNSIRTEL